MRPQSFRFSHSPTFKLRRAKWKSGSLFLLALLNLALGPMNSVKLSSTAMKLGPSSVIVCNFLVFLIIARILLYVEMFISQYTTRDCIDVWKIRPLLSHIGYVVVFWQIILLLSTHITCSFIMHYFLIIFEKPIPFYYCGPKSTKTCGAFRNNLTVNEGCSRREQPDPYCKNLYKSYSEYQFFQNDLMELNNPNAFIRWKIVLCSGIVSVITYLCVFKRTESMQCFIRFFSIYPMCGYFVLAMGAMLQRGVVDKFEEVMDTDFSEFSTKFKLPYVVAQVIFSIKIGTGLYLTLSSTGSLRSPSQSNATVVTIICCCFNTLTVVTTVMFFCTYSYVNEVPASFIIEPPMSYLFITIPRLLYDYRNRHLWLALFYSSNLVLSLGSCAIVFFCLMELVCRRWQMAADYPGLFSFLCLSFMFFVSIPLMSNVGFAIVIEFTYDYSSVVTPLLTTLECIVFVISYGPNNFTEDIHFLQGKRPGLIKKVLFTISVCFMFWATTQQVSYYLKTYHSSTSRFIGWLFMLLSICVIVLGMLLKLGIGWWQRRLGDVVRMDPNWGANSEMLRRSRDMFSAQAVTKEYMYRQNQLQAGILARQRRSNTRATCLRNKRQQINAPPN